MDSLRFFSFWQLSANILTWTKWTHFRKQSSRKSVIWWCKLVFPNRKIYFCKSEHDDLEKSFWAKCEEVNEDFVLCNMMKSFFLPEGYQSSHKAQHQEALPGRWLCGEGTAKGHLCALWCYEYQGSGTCRREWGRQQQVQVWSWLKSKENLYSCFGQEFCVNLWKTNQFSTWNLRMFSQGSGYGFNSICFKLCGFSTRSKIQGNSGTKLVIFGLDCCWNHRDNGVGCNEDCFLSTNLSFEEVGFFCRPEVAGVSPKSLCLNAASSGPF